MTKESNIFTIRMNKVRKSRLEKVMASQRFEHIKSKAKLIDELLFIASEFPERFETSLNIEQNMFHLLTTIKQAQNEFQTQMVEVLQNINERLTTIEQYLPKEKEETRKSFFGNQKPVKVSKKQKRGKKR